MLSRAAALLLLAAAGLEAQAPRVVLRGSTRGRAATLLREATASPHVVIVSPAEGVNLPRDSTIERTVLVVGGTARVASHVRGDVIVVNGDLYVRSGAQIAGRAVAIGGGVYRSSLASIAGDVVNLSDERFDLARAGDVIILERADRAPAPTAGISFPLPYGLRAPEYNRVDGVALPWGPRLTARNGRAELEPIVTYRSALGSLDGSVGASLRFGRRWALRVRGERTTLSNDRWIQTDPLNSVTTLVAGRDYRNYYRAEVGEARAAHTWRLGRLDVDASLGARAEFARSVGADRVWSLFNRRDSVDGARRPNPPIFRGRTHSIVWDVRLDWESEDLDWSVAAAAEAPFRAPGGSRFVQTTVGAALGFPTFGTQRLELESHARLTAGDTAPPQRYGYLGGSGTLRTFRLLSLGGDQLLFLESRYVVPIAWIRVRPLGSPSIALVHVLASAGTGTLPRLEQNLGLRLTVRPLRAEVFLDPVRRRARFRVGLSARR